MDLRRTVLAERLSASLFFVPMLYVLGGAALGLVSILVDSRISDDTAFPVLLGATVDSAREVLGTVATATITVAGIAFLVLLLIIQLASSEYSPRVVNSLFRDPFNKRVMGIVVGTFTFCLVVLRSARSELEDGGDPVVPTVGASIAVVLGIVAILAVVAFINHNAHTMEVSEILDRVTDHSLREIRSGWDEADPHPADTRPAAVPDSPGFTVCFDRNGWICRVDEDALLDLVPDGGTVRFETAVGRFAVPGTPLCTIWPAPPDPQRASDDARKAVDVGRARTVQQDAAYGVRQLVDVALKALSSGINDPTTAQDATFHMTALLQELLVRDTPAEVRHDDRGRRLLRPEAPSHDDLLSLAYDELRRAAAPHPTVTVYLLESLHLLDQALAAHGLSERSALLRPHAERIVAGAERADLLPTDLEAVRRAYARRFEPTATD